MAGVGQQSMAKCTGFTVSVHRSLTEPILLGGAPRSVAILLGTLAGCRLPRPAAVAGRPRPCGPIGSRRRGLGAAKRDPAVRRRRCAAICASPPTFRHLRGGDHHDEPRRISPAQHRRLADFLPWAALVAPGVVLNKDGSFPTHRPLSRPRSRLLRFPPNWSGSPAVSTTPCVASGVRLGDLRRGTNVISAGSYPANRFP